MIQTEEAAFLAWLKEEWPSTFDRLDNYQKELIDFVFKEKPNWTRVWLMTHLMSKFFNKYPEPLMYFSKNQSNE